jgi:hypothetical protein
MGTPCATRSRPTVFFGKDLPRWPLARFHFLVAPGGEISGESFSPLEMAVFLFGRGEWAKRILRKVWLRARLERTGKLALPYRLKPPGLPAPPRPPHVISRLNRSWVFPPLLLPEATIPSARWFDVLRFVREAHARGEPSSRLLDTLVVSSGFDWGTGSIHLEKLIGRSLTEEEITMAAGARRFWQRYAQGRARAAELQTIQELPIWQGDWAHFDRSQFVELLPGVILADHFERREFLANYIHEGEVPGLDFYSITGQPLFQHPFTAPFGLLDQSQCDSSV